TATTELMEVGRDLPPVLLFDELPGIRAGSAEECRSRRDDLDELLPGNDDEVRMAGRPRPRARPERADEHLSLDLEARVLERAHESGLEDPSSLEAELRAEGLLVA